MLLWTPGNMGLTCLDLNSKELPMHFENFSLKSVFTVFLRLHQMYFSEYVKGISLIRVYVGDRVL